MFIEAVTEVGTTRLSSVADSAFFYNNWNAKLTKAQVAKRKHKPPIDMGQRRSLNDLVFEALGSSFNRKDFVLFEKEINSYKERLWSVRSDPMDADIYKTMLDAAMTGELPSTYFLSPLRSVSRQTSYETTLTQYNRFCPCLSTWNTRPSRLA